MKQRVPRSRPTSSPSNWGARLVEPKSVTGRSGADLASTLAAFPEWQAASWSRLRQAYRDLQATRLRSLSRDARSLLVQWNPNRRTSTTAQVDSGSIGRRPCFLCPENLPNPERALPFGKHLVILTNPAPILPDHLVLAGRSHSPQAILPLLEGIMEFSTEVGERLTCLYNGPRCGASAPDHIHLQAVQSGILPEERLVRAGSFPPGSHLHFEMIRQGTSISVFSKREHKRAVILFRGSSDAIIDALKITLEILSAQNAGPGEPMINLVAFRHGAERFVLLFPRKAHRPGCYYAQGPESCITSPGAVDMAGLLVTVRQQDFTKMDEELSNTIFAETSMDLPQQRSLEEELKRRLPHA